MKDPAALADLVRFLDPGTPERLWTRMLEGHRRVLSALLPGLLGVAERGDAAFAPLRVLAAQAMGRIGEMDPSRITFALLERWMNAVERGGTREIGALMEGVLASASGRYRDACLEHLRRLHAGDRSRVAAAIGAYAWVGRHDLPLAMRELGAITRQYLYPAFDDALRLTDVFTAVDAEFQQLRHTGVEAERVSAPLLLREFLARVHKEETGTLVGVEMALAALCVTAEPAAVFRELRKWIVTEGRKAGVLVALLLVQERGFASRAEELAHGTEMGSRFVGTLLPGDDEVRQTAGFLGDLFEALAPRPGIDARILRHGREALTTEVARWVRCARAVPEQAAAGARLLELLARTHDGIARERVARILAHAGHAEPRSGMPAPLPSGR